MDAEAIRAVFQGVLRVGQEYDVTGGVLVGGALLYFVWPKVAEGIATIVRAWRVTEKK